MIESKIMLERRLGIDQVIEKTRKWHNRVESLDPWGTGDLADIIKDVIAIRVEVGLSSALPLGNHTEYQTSGLKLDLENLDNRILKLTLSRGTENPQFSEVLTFDSEERSVVREVSYSSVIPSYPSILERARVTSGLDQNQRSQLAELIWRGHVENNAPMLNELKR